VNNKQKHYHLHLYWFGLLLFLFPYTLSGLWKLFWGMGWQLFFEEKSFLSIDSLSYIIKMYAQRIQTPPVLGDFLINNPALGWFLNIAGTYWEVIAILPLFKPRHWRLTAALILIFHLMSFYTLNIIFAYQFAIVPFFLLTVPLHKEAKNWGELVEDLPLLGGLYRLVRRSRISLL
jgi:hypothetical protein